MAWQTIPVPDETSHKAPILVQLGQDFFLFTWLYAPRLERWTLSVATQAGVGIFTGRHVIPGQDLLWRSRHIPECPTGKLFALSANLDDLTPPTLQTLGKSVQLYWNPNG
jgi:hypothetical protein